MIPALVYFPLLFTGYFVIDMLGTKKTETVDPSMQTTEYLNPNLPQAKVKDDLEGKYESMLKSYGKIDDFSAIGNIGESTYIAILANFCFLGYESQRVDTCFLGLNRSIEL